MSDIVFLQETWLTNNEENYLVKATSEFYIKAVSAMDTSAGIISGRPYGGLAIMWRKSLGHICTITEFNDSRLIGLNVSVDGVDVLFVNVYLPYFNGANTNEYLDYLSRFSNIIEEHSTSYVYFIGDYNANLCVNNSGRARFANELASFCEEEDLILSDYALLDPQTYTFISHAHNTVSWLDHILTTNTGHSHICSIDIGNSFVTSDHLPLTVKLDFSLLRQKVYTTASKKSTINWKEATNEDIAIYKDNTAVIVNNLLSDLLNCNDTGCTHQDHIENINNVYETMANNLMSASEHMTDKRSRKTAKPIPGWNEYVREAHSDARDAFLLWQANAKPRYGPLCDLMKTTRARFKQSLRHCRAVEDRAKADAIARKFIRKDTNDFWKEVKKMTKTDSIRALSIDSVTGDNNICNLWKNHYEKLLNCKNDSQCKPEVMNFVRALRNEESFVFKECDVRNAIDKLRIGKSAGLDGLQSEHYKYADNIVSELLTNLFNAMLAHGYMPKSLMETLIVPIVKDKKASVTSKDNYRPIAITSVASKILELALLENMKTHLATSDNQFGFKQKSGTDMCVFTLKQIIDYYTKRSSPVYICFLDASKAFDRINHWTLFRKLIKRKIHWQIIRLMVFWYCTQSFSVTWGNHMSSCFNVTNGVRQGGILSPILFSVYMDDLSLLLNSSKVGCAMNGVTINHLMYADDTCLIAPTPAALQQLLNICSEFAYTSSVVFNEGKNKINVL